VAPTRQATTNRHQAWSSNYYALCGKNAWQTWNLLSPLSRRHWRRASMRYYRYIPRGDMPCEGPPDADVTAGKKSVPRVNIPPGLRPLLEDIAMLGRRLKCNLPFVMPFGRDVAPAVRVS